MAQGRGSATLGGLLAVCLLLGVVAHIADAETHTVDWSFNADAWSKGKRFRAGDVLEFNYDRTKHNVVVVDAGGYSTCSSSGRTYNSGSDHITLGSGTSYFICSLKSHCGMGMKMAITAN
ncbi:hypothetical protein U9M48_006867 [Paspalum notatum var. saurae]|uniref:Plantacyanin n=1 Tax=Paspalum notatum var. saurae TaxID=547442 RepID=A0AAQ3PVG1_PASNO